MKILLLKLCSLLLLVLVLLPLGLLRKLSGHSSFDARHFRQHSAWDQRRTVARAPAPSSARMDVEQRLGDARR